jgi:peptidylprolyl isomerase
MRTTRLLPLAVLTAATLGLAGCGSGDDAAPVAPQDPAMGSPADVAALATVEWSDGADGVPVLAFDAPFTVSDGVTRLIEDGTGDPVEVGQFLSIDYIVYSGDDASVLYSTYDLGRPDAILLGPDSMAPALWAVLEGSHVGATFLFASPDTEAAVGEDGSVPSFVAAMTVVGITNILSRAEGEAVEPVAGLPVVTLAEDGAPSIDFSGVTMPEGFVVQPLIVGAGAPVEVGQSITVQYTGWFWAGEVFDSSWGGEAATFPFVDGGLIDGWVQGLAGQPVGSQVLLIIPPELGYGDSDNGPIPGGSTLVFVVDILDAV